MDVPEGNDRVSSINAFYSEIWKNATDGDKAVYTELAKKIKAEGKYPEKLPTLEPVKGEDDKLVYRLKATEYTTQKVTTEDITEDTESEETQKATTEDITEDTESDDQ
jgi:hypothetical protein